MDGLTVEHCDRRYSDQRPKRDNNNPRACAQCGCVLRFHNDLRYGRRRRWCDYPSSSLADGDTRGRGSGLKCSGKPHRSMRNGALNDQRRCKMVDPYPRVGKHRDRSSVAENDYRGSMSAAARNDDRAVLQLEWPGANLARIREESLPRAGFVRVARSKQKVVGQRRRLNWLGPGGRGAARGVQAAGAPGPGQRC